MERSFAKEVQTLKKGAGDEFHGEGILAITKALLQSGVSYVGGYQGAPVSHLMDVLQDAEEILDEYGVHFEVCASEAAAGSMLGASINYPMRGAVVWKSTVGTNVASDALSNVASAGVVGGALIVLGEDYGEGASIIQERTHAFAMKSQLWLMDPRPDHERIVDLVEQGFQLSEASNTPVMMEFRIRACHMYGSFKTKDNRMPAVSKRSPLKSPEYNFERIALPPSTYLQEKLKIEKRWPAAIEFIRDHELNEVFDGPRQDVGIILQGGLYNSTMRALQQLGLADAFGQTEIPIYCLNVTYPLVPEELRAFCADKKAVMLIEEGQPDYLEQAINSILRKGDVNTKIIGKDVLPMAGEYTLEVLINGITKFVEGSVPQGVDLENVSSEAERIARVKADAAEMLGIPVPKRPPSFCTGCPERPVFTAMKLAEREVGEFHLAADIGCHTFSTLPPFNMGNTVMGYGLGLSSAAGVGPAFGDKRVVSVMGDGGFWHNGLNTGVTGAVFNDSDQVLVIMNNGYSSATGQQHVPSTNPGHSEDSSETIAKALRGVGVKHIKRITTYRVGQMKRALEEALTTKEKGLKVIIAESECQLARQRRIKPQVRKQLSEGKRVVRERFGIDEETCTGDHSCIRLSGCPSLTIKDNPDPLRKDPIATVIDSCVGCGLCGEVADAAVLKSSRTPTPGTGSSTGCARA